MTVVKVDVCTELTSITRLLSMVRCRSNVAMSFLWSTPSMVESWDLGRQCALFEVLHRMPRRALYQTLVGMVMLSFIHFLQFMCRVYIFDVESMFYFVIISTLSISPVLAPEQ